MPAEFSAQRPAYLFSTDAQETSISEHPVLSQLPKCQTDKPALFEGPKLFRPHMRNPNAPQYLPDWLNADIPQLAVHVLTFCDATIVTITFMHTLTDAMGFTAFLRGWTAVLRGEEDQIPVFVGFDLDDDPIETIHVGGSASKYVFADKLITDWGFFQFVFNYIWELVWWPRDELRTLCVPGKYLTELRESALVELADETQQTHSESTAPKPPFVSESDVLFSWWARIQLRALNPHPQRTICMLNVFDTRGVQTQMGRLPSPDVALLANATYALTSFVPAGKLLSSSVPLGWIASRLRYAVDSQRAPEQVQAIAAGARDSVRDVGRAPLYGEPNMMLVVSSNWHRGKLFQMDFSAAVADSSNEKSEKGQGYRKGRPSFVSASSTETGFSLRNSTVVLGKDGMGNWWISSCLRVGAWKRVREQLEKL